MLTLTGGHEKGWATSWFSSLAGDSSRRNLMGGSAREHSRDFINWGNVLAERAEGNDSTADWLCCFLLQHPRIWLGINGQLLQKLKWCWNDNSIKGADGSMSKCFTKDWVDIKLISQWQLMSQEMKFQIVTVLCSQRPGIFLNMTWLKNIMKLIQTQDYQYG